MKEVGSMQGTLYRRILASFMRTPLMQRFHVHACTVGMRRPDHSQSRSLFLFYMLTALLIGPFPFLISQASTAESFPRAKLELVLADGSQHLFSVELARTRAQIMRGLMYRETLPDGTGMLFDYGGVTSVSMWMKNTPLPLDMVFADGEGLVVHVVEDTVPLSIESIRAPVPVRYVLEIPAGTARSLGIGPGARLALVPSRQ